jgi:hypothetical protein
MVGVGLSICQLVRRCIMRQLWILPLFALVIGCADSTFVEPDIGTTPNLAAAEGAKGQGNVVKMVPLKMKGTWWYAFEGDESVCDDVPGTATIQFIGFEGNATHLGKVTGTNVNCFGPGDPMSREFLAQGGEFKAANGDVLIPFGTEATLSLFGDYSFEIGPVDFVGGTGRFENATGWYRLYGADAIGAGPFTMIGEISSVGSSK